jgi:hypothetical protein
VDQRTPLNTDVGAIAGDGRAGPGGGARPLRTATVARMPRDLATGGLRGAARGVVHSVFAGAVNLRLGRGGIVSLHGPGALRAPFALALARWPLAEPPRPGALVTLFRGRLAMGATRVQWRDAAHVETSVAPDRGALTGIARAAASLPDRPPPGLGTDAGLPALAAAITRGDPAEFLASALGLVGLGEGLTPAGDDCLCGVLAVLHRGASPILDDAGMIRALSEAARTRTTELGREFLLHAIRGRFAEPVLDVVSGDADRMAAGAERLHTFGASSGEDTLAGVRLAARALTAGPLPWSGLGDGAR